MADAAHAPDFWRSVAARFRDDSGVVFDLYNEPHDISWGCWRDGVGCTVDERCRGTPLDDIAGVGAGGTIASRAARARTSSGARSRTR